jgi:hypothetical protein
VTEAWMLVFYDPITMCSSVKSVFPPEHSPLPWDEMPMWLIEDPAIGICWFLFQDEYEALEFKLKYL